jgi:hypothetical protein
LSLQHCCPFVMLLSHWYFIMKKGSIKINFLKFLTSFNHF